MKPLKNKILLTHDFDFNGFWRNVFSFFFFWGGGGVLMHYARSDLYLATSLGLKIYHLEAYTTMQLTKFWSSLSPIENKPPFVRAGHSIPFAGI